MAKTELGFPQFALAAPQQYEDVEITGATTGAPDHGAQEQPFPPFDPSTYASQLIWLAITFGLFYWLMTRVALPRLANILETRRDRIANDLEEAERFKAETDEAIKAYETALADARARAMAIAAKAREKADQELAAEKAETDKELQEKIAEAEKRIAEVKKKALGEVDSIAAEVTQSLIAKLIGEKLTKTDAKKVVARVKEKANAS